MESILKVTISETGQKIDIGELRLFHSLDPSIFFYRLFNKISSILLINPNCIYLTLDDILYLAPITNAKKYNINIIHASGTKTHTNNNILHIFYNSPIYRYDGSLKDIIVHKIYTAQYKAFATKYINKPESSMKRIGLYDNYNLQTKLFFPGLQQLFRLTNQDLASGLIDLAFEIILGPDIINGIYTPFVDYVNRADGTILFNGVSTDLDQVIHIVVDFFITHFNYHNAKPITLDNLPSLHCNVYANMSLYSLLYLFKLYSNTTNVNKVYLIAQEVANNNFYDIDSGITLIDAYLYEMGNLKIEDVGIIYTLLRGSIWPYRKVISKKGMLRTNIEINPLRNFREGSLPYTQILHWGNTIVPIYRDEDIKLTIGPRLANNVVSSSLVHKVKHFDNGFNPNKIYKRIKTIFPEFFLNEMIENKNIVFAGGAPSICASDYLWDLLQKKKITTDIDLFVIGKNTASREYTKDRLLEYLAGIFVIVGELIIRPNFRYFESVIKVEWVMEKKEIRPSVQIICTDVVLPMEVLYNFDMTHIQIGISGPNKELFCTPEYLYYTPRSETLLIRSNIRLPRLIKAMTRGFTPVMRIPYTQLITSGKPFIGRKIYLKLGEISTIEYDGEEVCTINGEEELCYPPYTFGYKRTLFEVGKKVKLDGRFRNAFDGYIGKAKPSFVLNEKYINMVETLYPIYKKYSQLTEKREIIKQLSEHLYKNYEILLLSSRGFSIQNVVFQELTEDERKDLPLENSIQKDSFKMMEFTLPVFIQSKERKSGYKYYYAKPVLTNNLYFPNNTIAFTVKNARDIWNTISFTLIEDEDILRVNAPNLLLFRFRMLALLYDITYSHLDQSESPITSSSLDPNFIYEGIASYKEYLIEKTTLQPLGFWKVNQVMKYLPSVNSYHQNKHFGNTDSTLTTDSILDLLPHLNEFSITNNKDWKVIV